MAENSVIISSEEEAKLLKPIDEYVEEIQKKIDALRADGFDKVSDLKKQIAIAKENKNLSATQRDKIIENSKKELENAKKVEADNKEEIKKLIAEAESYLAAHYKKDYYDVVNKSCKAAKAEENSRYEKIKADLKSEHQKKVASLKDAEEIKAEKYVLKNKLFDAQMAHESKLQEIKDRRHEAFMHKYQRSVYRNHSDLHRTVYHHTDRQKYTAADCYQHPEYLTAGIPAYVPCTWCCRSDPVNRYRPFRRTYGWYGYGYSNHHHA